MEMSGQLLTAQGISLPQDEMRQLSVPQDGLVLVHMDRLRFYIQNILVHDINSSQSNIIYLLKINNVL